MKRALVLALLLLAACASSTDRPANESPTFMAADVRGTGLHTPKPQADKPAPNGFQSEKPPIDTGEPFSRELKLLFIEQDFRWEARSLNDRLKRESQLAYQGLFLGAQDGWKQPTSSGKRDIRPLTADFVRAEGTLRQSAMFDALAYDVVIVGDVHGGEDGVDADCWLTLENLVIEGGGLVLIAGARAMPSAHWQAPAFARLAPVEAGTAPSTVNAGAEKWCGVTGQGWTSGLFNLAQSDADNRRLWGEDIRGYARGELNGHFWLCDTVQAKAKAEVLARTVTVGQSINNGRPLIVSMEVGRGRVLWIGTDDMHRLRELVGDAFYGSFYRNAIRWAANDPGPK